jgi:hypothetical protein
MMKKIVSFLVERDESQQHPECEDDQGAHDDAHADKQNRHNPSVENGV